jgi:tripeptide aminopeptidase
VAETTVKVLLRDFDTAALEKHADQLRAIAASVEQEIPGSSIEVQITPQYRNMADGLRNQPQVVEFAEKAHARLGRQPRRTIIRGGTDGSMLTAKGLPTPNLSAGQHTPHSPLEWACLDEMARAAELLVELVQVWGEAHQH